MVMLWVCKCFVEEVDVVGVVCVLCEGMVDGIVMVVFIFIGIVV